MVKLPSMLSRLEALGAWAKAGVVLGGYVAVFLAALGVVWVYVILTSGPARDASPGMYGFALAALAAPEARFKWLLAAARSWSAGPASMAISAGLR